MSDQEIIERVIANLAGFDEHNWLAFLNLPVEIDVLADVAAGIWNEKAHQAALNYGCVGCTLAAAFLTDFRVSYHAIADVFKARYGEGFWEQGFRHPLGSRLRSNFIADVRANLPAVIQLIRERTQV